MIVICHIFYYTLKIAWDKYAQKKNKNFKEKVLLNRVIIKKMRL